MAELQVTDQGVELVLDPAAPFPLLIAPLQHGIVVPALTDWSINAWICCSIGDI